MTAEDIRDESRMLLAAERNGMVECPHCHRLVMPEQLGRECDVCGAEGCDQCITPSEDGEHRECAEPCECFAPMPKKAVTR